MRTKLLSLLLPAALVGAACGSSGEPTDPGRRADVVRTGTDAAAPPPADVPQVDREAPAALIIAPSDATLEVRDGAPAALAYTVDARYADGRIERGIPAVLALDVVGVGAFTGNTFTASGAAGGVGTVTASFRGATATTRLTVRLNLTRAQAGVAPDLATRAVAMLPMATDDPALRPAVAYPYDGTVMPPNLYRVEWQVQPVAGADLYVTTFRSPTTVLHYVSTDSRFTLAPDDWRAIVNSNRARQVEVTVRASRAADMSRAGSASLHVSFAGQDLLGGLYYFTTNEDDSRQGIFRYDFGTPVAASTRFLSRSGPGTCVGCHALSRDGERMAVTFEGGYGYLGSLRVRDPSRYEVGGAAGPQRGGFAAYFDADRSLLAVYDNAADPMGNPGNPGDPLNGQLVVYDAQTGAIDPARQVPIGAGHRAAHVAIAPDMATAAYVDYADTDSRPIHEQRGSIMTTTYDRVSRTWSAPRVLVPYDGAINNYYPSFSPDGRWILFNRAPGDAYDNARASVWAVPYDASRAPIELAAANRAAGMTNSWPRWAPFMQSDELGTTRMWITFSSKRDYGTRLVGESRAQLWMAAFDPIAAAQGRDGSSPAFWLPFQDIETRNHTATWTERVAPRNCERDSDCADPGLRCNPTARTCEAVAPPG